MTDRSDPDRSDPDRSDPDRSDPDRSDPDRSDPDSSDPDRSHPDHDPVGPAGGGDQRIDDLARRAGAEVRRPAPPDFADGVRRARRRQQNVRAGAGVVGVAALLAVGAVVARGTGDDGTIGPATVPETVVGTVLDTQPGRDPDDAPATTPEPGAGTATTDADERSEPPPDDSSPDGDPTTTVAGAPGAGSPAFVPAGTDADGIPDAVFAPADPALDEQNVYDPVTLDLVETRAITRTPSQEALTYTSASGAVTYGYPFERQGDLDACGQTRSADWVTGADPSGLPERVLDITLSADGRVGVAVSVACPSDAEPAPDGTSGPHEVTVARFEADDPTRPSLPVVAVDGGAESYFRTAMTDDGSFVLLETFPIPLLEGNRVITRVADTGSGDVVAELRDDVATGLPRADCGFGFVGTRLVGNSGFGYVAICPDEGLVVVLRDLVTGDTVEIVNAEYAGRSYETMPNASFQIDRASYTTPGDAWYLLCAEREIDGVIGPEGSRPCWVGHGAEPMRELPSTIATLASFEPLPG